MKVCVFSDSHGYVKNMMAAVELEKPDACFFLGDGERDLEKLRESFPDMTVYAVRGNCDIMSQEKDSICPEIEGVKIFATHGHMSRVKYEGGLETLSYQALEAGASVALYGHTHTQHCSVRNGVTRLNPGQIGRGYYPSYAVLDIENGFCRPELKTI